MKRIAWLLGIVIVGVLLLISGYYGVRTLLHSYTDRWSDKLIALDEQGLLSHSFGAAWQDVVYGDEMEEKLSSTASSKSEVQVIEGIPVDNYPSLDVVRRLNEVSSYSNEIRIEDRNGKQIALITTDHRRVSYKEFPQTLIQAVVAAEDKDFFENEYGYSYEGFVRASLRALKTSILSFKVVKPKGTSTITQQVGKMFISQLDENGNRFVAKNITRKKREIQIAAALRKRYTPEEIMEVYLNHSLTSSYGLVGAADIAQGLWHKDISELSDAESVYLARMVKWGMNIPSKIRRQCHIDMPRIQKRLQWSDAKADSVLAEIDTLTFYRPKQVDTQEGYLVDVANIYWLKFLAQRGYKGEELASFDLLNPTSLIRQKGNVTITLEIDLPLQRFLVQQVSHRGFGADTTIQTDIRIGSEGSDIVLDRVPRDTLRQLSIITKDTIFTEQDREGEYLLHKEDTLITNIRYKKVDKKGTYRRSVFYYTRGSRLVDGQYYAYSIMDSKSGKLRAYYSRDRQGSQAVSLLLRKTPNGSAVAKPVINALMFDLGYFEEDARWSDMTPPTDSTLRYFWRGTYWKSGKVKKGKATFYPHGLSQKGYTISNHGKKLEGDRFVWDQLNRSNNILAVENLFRLTGKVFDKRGEVTDEGVAVGRLLYRLGLLEQFSRRYRATEITGVRVYKELARLVGASVDSVDGRGIPDDRFSVALGTLELTLLEQMHLFNVLYNNTLIRDPKEHPSLFIKKITMHNQEFLLDTLDTLIRVHPFSSSQAIRPSLLALFHRLGRRAYDVEVDASSVKPTDSITYDTTYQDLYPLQGFSNFAKSGTTDDVRRPYYADITSKKRINYGLWNGVVRVDLSRFDASSKEAEVADITVACVAEGSRIKPRFIYGQSIHQFITSELLAKGGQKVSAQKGFYHLYEKELDRRYAQKEKAIADSLEWVLLVEANRKSGLIDTLKVDSLSSLVDSIPTTTTTVEGDLRDSIDQGLLF